MPLTTRAFLLGLLLAGLAGCASMSSTDPLSIDVAGIEPLPGEGMELRLAVRVRIQNPNTTPVDYSGAALTLELNGRRLASGVTDTTGTVPRYGETVLTIPVTISAFDMARQLFGFMNESNPTEIRFRVQGKLDGGLLGTRRFTDEGTFQLPARDLP
jgi:LEA14-like dessication related protein